MRYSEREHLYKLASIALGDKLRQSDGAVLESQTHFVLELATIMEEYANFFNGLVAAQKPDAAIRVMRLGNTRAGFLVLRGKEKLTITVEGNTISVSLVTVGAYREKRETIMVYKPQFHPLGIVTWNFEGNEVTPDFIAKMHLAPFFVDGGTCYQSRKRETHHTMGASVKLENCKEI